MGLDIYVGSLTRYYRGNWETVCAQAAREQGMDFHVIRTNPGPPERMTDPVEIRQVVEDWRSGLESALHPHFAERLDWEEGTEVEYVTDKPDWVGYAGLVILAAHTACQEHPIPEEATTDFNKSPAFQALAAQEFQCRFSQLFEVEVWLPYTFPFTFRGPDVTGSEVCFGSSGTLLEQLRCLNNENYAADPQTLAKWRRDGACSKDTFDQTARFGLSVFLQFAEFSMQRRLPMKLDY